MTKTMRTQFKSTPLINLIASLCLLFAGCGQAPPSNSLQGAKVEPRVNGKAGGKITYRLTAPPKTLNYLLAADEPTLIASFFMMTARLVEFDHQTQKFVPGLAESWTTTDGKTVDVKLRDGLKFSDGQPLTTDDIVFTLTAMTDEKVKSPAFHDAMMVDDKPIETKKISDTEMQFIFPQPVASVENYFVNIGVLPRHVLETDFKSGKLGEAWKIDSPPANIVTSGPFTVSAATPGEKIEFVRNAHYYKKDSAGTQLPYIDALTIEIVADANNTFARLGQGTLDIADRIRANDFAEFTKGQSDVRGYDAGPGLSIDHIIFNQNTTAPDGSPLNNQTKRAWFADKRFRQAVATAIDRDSIANITLQGLASPLYGIVSPANRVWANTNLQKINNDLKSAEQLLEQAGFKKGGTPDAPVLTDAQNNPVEFTLLVPAENEARKLMAAVVQEDLAKLGIKLQVVPLDNSGVTDRLSKTYDYDAILLGLSLTDIEPSSLASFLLSSGSSHQWQPKQKTPATAWEGRIDELFGQQASERDSQKRLALFSEIQSIFRDELPVIPLVSRHVITASNKKIGNYAPSVIVPYSLWNVEDLFIKQ
jgi:peptide/nickel transport system substrate-binding protein